MGNVTWKNISVPENMRIHRSKVLTKNSEYIVRRYNEDQLFSTKFRYNQVVLYVIASFVIISG